MYIIFVSNTQRGNLLWIYNDEYYKKKLIRSTYKRTSTILYLRSYSDICIYIVFIFCMNTQ